MGKGAGSVALVPPSCPFFTPFPCSHPLPPLSRPCIAVGILLAQSRWAKPLRKAVVGKKSWFWLHIGINVSGVALVITAFAIAVRCAQAPARALGKPCVPWNESSNALWHH